MQKVQTSLLPFNFERDTIEVAEGLTLQEIVGRVFPRNIHGVEIHVTVGGELVPAENWAVVRPKQHALVGVNVVAAGGGGKKNPLATILSIAVVIAAPYVAAAIAPAAAAAVAAGTATLGQLAVYGAIRIGIGLIGQLAVSALTSTPNQSGSNGGVQRSLAESPTQFVEGATNQILRFGVIPVNLGTNRMFPPQAALPYTENAGNNQYARQLFTYGYGKQIIANRKLGETPVDDYDEVEMEDRLDADLHLGTEIYSNDVFQEGFSVLVSNAVGDVVRTTQPETDEMEIDITFNRGLARFDDQGNRQRRSVQFEVVYSLTGQNDYSSGSGAFEVASTVINIPKPEKVDQIGYGYSPYRSGSSKHTGIVIINLDDGRSTIRYPTGGDRTSGFKYSTPSGWIRIATFDYPEAEPEVGEWVPSITDDRNVHYDKYIEDNTDFTLTLNVRELTIGAGTLLDKLFTVSAATSQALRKTFHFKFPAKGQYDIKINRITSDTTDPRIVDQANLTAMRSITYGDPVLQEDISGTGMRIRASDQLNGSVDRFNVVASLVLDYYDSGSAAWIEGVSSNPAAMYRYVLQSPAFAKRLPDSRVNLTKLQEWSEYCDSLGLTYNKVIDSESSIDDVLNDIAAAGFATPHKVEGVYGVIIDNERPLIKGLVTPRNSSNYSGNINYPELPHAIRVQFRNQFKDYALDERIVYAPGYDQFTATLFERVEFNSCTDPTLAYYYGLRYLRTAVLQPEVHKFKQDFENLTYNRGDRISFVNDVILVGVGQGLIKELIYDGDQSHVTGFVIDETVNIPTADQFGVRIRHADASSFTYYSLNTVIGETDTFTFTDPVVTASAPGLTSLCAFTEFDKELDLIVTEVKINKDQSAQITAINYAPERFDVDSEVIPSFNSNVTLPSSFYRPLAPIQAGDIQSDEEVLIRNPDGSFLSRMIIPLENRNEPSVTVSVRVRVANTTEWVKPDILRRNPEQLIISGLQDGQVYDIEIRYQRQGGTETISKPLQLNGVTYFGASKEPDDVQGFEVTGDDTTGLFEWLPNDDVDLSHYVIKFTTLTSGVNYKNAQLLADNIKTNRISLPMQAGTYLIKAVDFSGNESVNATLITSLDNGAFNNVVEQLTQQETWNGVKENCHVIDGNLRLEDPTLEGIYYFDPGTIDLSEIYESTLSSSVVSSPAGYKRVRSITSIRSETSLLFDGQLIIRDQTSIRSLTSVRGFEGIDWSTILQMRSSSDNITWTDWVPFKTGKLIFRYIEFRVVINSDYEFLNPILDIAEVVIDMPDRYEAGENINCPTDGVSVSYNATFANNPALNITIQGQQEGERPEFVSKTSSGFTIRIYSDTLSQYVARSFDYDAAGYGRVV